MESLNTGQAITLLLTWLGGSGGTYVLVEVVKAIKAIPVDEGQAARIRTVSLALSAVFVAGAAWMNGTLEVNNLQDVFTALAAVVAVWGGAHGVHKLNSL